MSSLARGTEPPDRGPGGGLTPVPVCEIILTSSVLATAELIHNPAVVPCQGVDSDALIGYNGLSTDRGYYYELRLRRYDS